MNRLEKARASNSDRPSPIYMILLCVICLSINYIFAQATLAFHLPLYLDCIGIVLAAALGGYLPGIAVGYASNLINSVGNPETAYYATLSVLIAVTVTFFQHRGWLKKVWGVILCTLCMALIGGALGFLVTWMLYGFEFGTNVAAPVAKWMLGRVSSDPFWAQFAGDMAVDVADKAITMTIALTVLRLVPSEVKTRLEYHRWRQTPLTEDQLERMRKRKVRVISLRQKLLFLIAVAILLISVAAIGISFFLYNQSTIDEHAKLADGVTALVASHIDPEMVDDYLAEGEAAPGYLETKERLTVIRDSSAVIEYVYVYQILPDGCHVVFDLDTEDVPGSLPGELVEFDPSFADYIPDLLAGREIEPLVTNDTYGWLLTVYRPIYNAEGDCVCYAAADIAMTDLAANEASFLTKVSSLALGFFVLILGLALELVKYNVVLPINTIARAASRFAYESETARSDSVEHIRSLNIRTGDEIENLYQAFAKTTADTMQYITDVQEKNEVITQMQDGLIMVLADMVESRDKCTGDHVRKTAAYADVICRELRKEGKYADRITDEFTYDVVHSAPLHDVGKIQVSDTLLNKPGRLTDEEFRQMKKHTLAGREIIEKAIEIVPESGGYLTEAKNLAEYHHERWDGTGYPCGLKGEEIPLSARIMAVADVFDALVSRRSYKEPFPFEKAMDIIREGAGSHFDPIVAQAFLNAEDEVRAVANKNMEL